MGNFDSDPLSSEMKGSHPPRHWTSVRIELRDWLRRNAPSLAELYEGAVELAFGRRLPGWTRLVSHSVREIRNGLPRAIAGLKGGRSVDYKTWADDFAAAWEAAGLGSDGEIPSSVFATDGKVPGSPNVAIPPALARMLATFVKQHNLVREKPKEAASRLFSEIDEKNQEQSDMLRLIIDRWMQATEWFVRRVHDSGKTDEDIEVSELRTHFTTFEHALGAVVNEFFTTLKELDEVLEDANTSTG